MKDWKLRQKIFYQIFEKVDLGDNLEDQETIEEFDIAIIIDRALNYPFNESPVCYYPGKSYATAIIFSLLLQKNFGGEIYDYLSDQDLFMGEDPYFLAYRESKDIYDAILAEFPVDCIESPENYSENLNKTIDYFMMEYLFHEKTKIFAPI